MINPKNYILLKYLLTFANFFLVIIVTLSWIVGIKNVFSIKTYLILSIAFIFVSLIFYGVFFYSKWKLHKKVGYKNQKKDNIFLTIFIISICLLFVLPITSIVLIDKLTVEKLKIMSITSIVLEIILMFVSSVLETMSRFQEYICVYQKWELNAQYIDAINLAKKNQQQYVQEQNESDLKTNFQNLIDQKPEHDNISITTKESENKPND